MSMPMNNIDKSGYPPPAFGSGYPPMSGPIVAGYQPGGEQPLQANYGFGQPGYAPVPQMPEQPYGGAQPYRGQQPPIVTQPGAPPPQPGYAAHEWMTIPPTSIPNCPPGLEYLTTIDQLLIKQQVEVLEMVTSLETNNRYSIKNSLGQKVYYAKEDNDCCTRNCCGPMRPFDMKIFDNYRQEVLHLYRPLACDCCCFPCCLQKMEVSSPPGTVIGTIEQEWTICKPSFRIKNQFGDVVLRVEGPVCTASWCGSDVKFRVVSLTGERVGKISKKWSGLVREAYTDADFFGISFPMDLDVRVKATLLGATFLIDYMFFEHSHNN